MPDIALYPGTFDPITCGHLGIITKAKRVFQRVVVGVSSSRKDTLLPLDKRLRLVQEACRHLPDVECEIYHGLTAHYASKINATVILRGIRSLTDFEREKAMVWVNDKFAPQTTTMFMVSDPNLAHISSTMVREVKEAGGDIKDLVPPCIASSLSPIRQGS